MQVGNFFQNMDVKCVLFLLLAVVATGYTQKPCCFPDEFEIKTGSTVGYSHHEGSGIISSYAETAFDYTNKRSGALVTLLHPDGSSEDYQIISDYKVGVLYQIDATKKECQKDPLVGAMVHCVPENATAYGSAYLGNKKLTVDSFGVVLKEECHEGQMTLSVTQGDCLPNSIVVTENIHGTGILALTGYFDYVGGISDPSKYFTVPDYCPKAFSKEPQKCPIRPYLFFL